MSEETFLTSAEVADQLGVTVGTVNRWVREGYVDAARPPGKRSRLRFHPGVVDVLRRRMTPTAPPEEAA